MKNLFTLLLTATLSVGLYAQQLVQVTDINDATPAMLANCNDTSSYYLDTVKVVCYVVTAGNLSEVVSSSINGANGTRPFIWVNDTANGGAPGPFTGLEVMGVNWGTSQATTGFTSLISGDLVEITGVVGMYNGATQFQPLNNTSINILAGNNPTFTPAPIQVSELNDANQINNLVTGEKWEGVFIEVNNVTVTSVSPFGSGVNARVNFTVADANGNSMEVYDFFLAQKLTTWATKNPNSPASFGKFTAPAVGTLFTSLKGVIEHSGNGCTGGTGQGYRLQPFDSTHYTIGKALPNFISVQSSPSVPTSSDPITVNADIVDSDGSIDSVNIFWTANPSTPLASFTKAAMPLSSGITYSYTIPAQADGTVIRYFIEATDDDTATSRYPINPDVANIYVRDNGLTIMDVQTPSSGGNSPFVGQTVTVKGFVSASERACDLGYVYIQDTSAMEYAGLPLRGSLALANLYRNEMVLATGTIQESFGFTEMVIDSVKSLGMGAEVQPIVLDPSDTTEFDDYEKYESMLVKFQAPGAGEKLQVVRPDLGFGDYAISTQKSNTTYFKAVRRVLAGRTDGTRAQSSLYVQLVSDSSWATNDGTMFYAPIVTDTNITMDAMTGIMWYAFGNFKLTPRNNDDLEGLSVALDTNGCGLNYFSMEELVNTVALDMYPNPATSNVTISAESDNITVQVYDLKGTLLIEKSSNNQGTINLNVSGMNHGLYLVRVQGDDNEFLGTYKLIIGQ